MSTLGWIHTVFGLVALLPGTEDAFGAVVAGTTIVVVAAGAYLIRRYLPRTITRVPARFRRRTQTITSYWELVSTLSLLVIGLVAGIVVAKRP